MPRPHPSDIKQRVVGLCKNGRTYKEVGTEFGIPKSTLSNWMKNAGVPRDRTRQLEHLARVRIQGTETIKRKKLERLAQARSRAESVSALINISNQDLQKALLAMLYWAEGSKGDHKVLIFVNTDPLLILFYLELLRSAYDIDESKLRVRLHLHYYHKIRETRAFWSKLLNVPDSQFGKIYVKKRSTQKKFRQNFRGICTIVYHDTGIQRELLLLGKITAEKLCSEMLSSFNG